MSREGPGNFGCSAAAAGGHFSKRGTMLPDCNVPGRMHCGVLPTLRHRWSARDFCGTWLPQKSFFVFNDLLLAKSKNHGFARKLPGALTDHAMHSTEFGKMSRLFPIRISKMPDRAVEFRLSCPAFHLIKEENGTFPRHFSSLDSCRFISHAFRLIELTVVQICIKTVLFHQALMIPGFND